MGDFTNGPVWNTVTLATVVVMVVLTAGMVVTLF